LFEAGISRFQADYQFFSISHLLASYLQAYIAKLKKAFSSTIKHHYLKGGFLC